jgi:hypothetical protein
MSPENETVENTNTPVAADDPRQPSLARGKQRGTYGMELIFIIGFIGLWFALQLWILPKFGVST